MRRRESTPPSSVSRVAAAPFTNGADNIGIYTQLFASSGYKELLTILIVFFILLAVWRQAGYYLTPVWGRTKRTTGITGNTGKIWEMRYGRKVQHILQPGLSP